MEKQRQRKVNNRSGIVICGSYGLGNAGDESILKAILQEVRTVAPAEEITVLSRNPEETKLCHGVRSLHMFDLPAIYRLMGRTKLYINGGGSLIRGRHYTAGGFQPEGAAALWCYETGNRFGLRSRADVAACRRGGQ